MNLFKREKLFLMEKEIPILFKTAMVQAILAGKKTQTRRTVKPQPIDNREVDGNLFTGDYKGYVKVDGHPNWQQQFAHEFARWKPGVVLWVKETMVSDKIPNDRNLFLFKADIPIAEQKDFPYQSALFMKKVDARIWLEITDIIVERLQDVQECDAIAEGVNSTGTGELGNPIVYENYLATGASFRHSTNNIRFTARDSFQSLWYKINGEESWKVNPWVWVVDFKVLSTTGKPA